MPEDSTPEKKLALKFTEKGRRRRKDDPAMHPFPSPEELERVERTSPPLSPLDLYLSVRLPFANASSESSAPRQLDLFPETLSIYELSAPP